MYWFKQVWWVLKKGNILEFFYDVLGMQGVPLKKKNITLNKTKN